MLKQLTHITILVQKQDEALRWYTEKLGFEKRDDIRNGTFRWLTIGIRGQANPKIVLLEPNPEHHGEGAKGMKALIGKSPTWVLEVDDCRKMVDQIRKKGVKIVREPENKPYGVHALIEDLYGNQFDLTQPWA